MPRVYLSSMEEDGNTGCQDRTGYVLFMKTRSYRLNISISILWPLSAGDTG